MKKITLLILLLFSFFDLNAQIWTINSCSNSGVITYGPMYSSSTANTNNRTAVIYPASQLSSLIGQNLNGIYFQRNTASGSMTGTPNFKVYLKEVAANDWGTSSIDWATETTGATLVYDSDPSAIVGSVAGWKLFPLSTNFLYSGSQNLAVFMEYSNASGSGTTITWNYEFTSPCVTTTNNNTTKYNNNSTGTLQTTLTSTNYRRPLIGFDFVVSCNAPSTLSSTNLTTTGADISWIENSIQPQNGYEYYNSASSTEPTPTTIPTGTTATGINSTSLTGLTPATTYYFWVRGNCGTGDKSVWSGPISYTTLCVEVAAFVENFDAWPTGSAAGMPVCWSKLGTGIAYLTTASNTPMSAPNRLYMNISATTDVYAVMPLVSNLQANTHRLRFKVYCTSANKTMRVGYFTDPTDTSTFVDLQSFTMPSTNLASTLEFEVVPTTVPVGVNQLVFSITPGTSTTAYIDDVKWELNSSCLEPNTLIASFITNNSANLGWTPGGSEALWDIQYGEPNFALGSGTFINDVTTNPYLLTGLLANTSYQYYVRTKCSGSNSSWAGPFTFKTQCDYVTEFVENFDSYPSGSTSLPDCWSRAGSSTSTYITTGALAPMSPSNRLYMFASGTTPTEGYAILPGVSNLAANTHRLKFKAYATVAGRTLEVGYLTDPSDVATFIQLQEITLPGTSLASTEEFAIIPGALPAGIYHLCIKNPAFPSASTTAYIDDVIWEAIPSCVEPNTLFSNLITNTSAQINWTEGNTATAWQIEYGVAGFVQGSVNGTIVSAPTNPFTLSGLIGNTNYDVYVRAVCSTTDSSPWAGPIVFKTLCDDVTEYTENFEGSTTGSTAPMPDCWYKGGNGTVYITTGSVAPMSPANRLYMFSSGTATVPTVGYAILPSVSNLQANTHRLKFFAYASAVDRTLEVGYLTDASDINTFVQLQEITLPSTVAANATEFIIIPGALPAGVKNLCIKNPAIPTGSTTAYLDNFKWEAIPTCIESTMVTENFITNNSAVISWTEGGTATAWEIEYGLTGFVQGSVDGTIVAAPTNPFTLNGLLANTTYDVYVRAVCSTSDSSPWSNISTFKTQCDDVTEFFEDFETWPSGTTSLPDCWSKAGSSTSTYITTGATAPMSPTKRLYMFASGTTPTVGYAILPSVSNLQANTHRLRFKAYATLANRTLEIGYFTNASDVSTFVMIQELTLPGTTAATALEFIVAPPALPAGVKNLVIKNPGFTGSSTTAYMDDFYWEASPTTAPVCVTNLVATPDASCGNFATTISWDAAANANGYKLTVGTTTGANDVLDNLDLGSVTTYDFTGTFNTTYFYKLVPYNNVADASGCVEQSFTTAVTGCYCPSVPTSNDGSGITNVLIGTTNFANGDVFYTDNTASPVDMIQGASNIIQVTFNTSIYTYDAHIYVDLNDDYNFDASELFYSGASVTPNPYTLDASFVMPATAPLGNHRMRLVSADSGLATPNPCYSGSYGVTIDFTANVILDPLSTSDFDNSTFTYYPNPVNDILNISHTSEISSISVFNMIGQSILFEEIYSNNYQLDMSSLNAGVYLVKVKANNTEKTIKITKQ